MKKKRKKILKPKARHILKATKVHKDKKKETKGDHLWDACNHINLSYLRKALDEEKENGE